MPLFYLRGLTSPSRTDVANRHVARYLAFVAGAANAGGFFAVHQYTSHMSGIVSAAADDLAVGSIHLVWKGFVAVFAFFSGACTSTVLIRWGRDRELHSQYALPLLSEAMLLAIFGLIGQRFTGSQVLGTVILLCFSMGLQNAMITKISGSVIRTTHLTGLLTDIGIAIGRLSYSSSRQDVQAAEEFSTLRLLVSLVVLFFIGGVIGAVGFRHVGFLFTMPLSAMLVLLAIMPLIDDLRGRDISFGA
ncbi:MAG: YoaK family protein [Acidobacteriaceae bacterium]